MPRYEYQCPECPVDGTHSIKIVEKPISQYDSEERCSVCGAVMNKLISKTSFSLKGEGWARDRYGKGGGS